MQILAIGRMYVQVAVCNISSLDMPFLSEHKLRQNISSPAISSRKNPLFSGRIQIDEGGSPYGGMDLGELLVIDALPNRISFGQR